MGLVGVGDAQRVFPIPVVIPEAGDFGVFRRGRVVRQGAYGKDFAEVSGLDGVIRAVCTVNGHAIGIPLVVDVGGDAVGIVDHGSQGFAFCNFAAHGDGGFVVADVLYGGCRCAMRGFVVVAGVGVVRCDADGFARLVFAWHKGALGRPRYGFAIGIPLVADDGVAVAVDWLPSIVHVVAVVIHSGVEDVHFFARCGEVFAVFFVNAVGIGWRQSVRIVDDGRQFLPLFEVSAVVRFAVDADGGRTVGCWVAVNDALRLGADFFDVGVVVVVCDGYADFFDKLRRVWRECFAHGIGDGDAIGIPLVVENGVVAEAVAVLYFGGQCLPDSCAAIDGYAARLVGFVACKVADIAGQAVVAEADDAAIVLCQFVVAHRVAA